MESNKGSISLFVLIAMLFFLTFITGVYIANINSESVQAKASTRIKEIYEKDTTEEGMGSVYDKIMEPFNLDYISDGLILHYDGINNTGVGHKDTAETWRDLSGHGNDGIKTGGVWIGDAWKSTTDNEKVETAAAVALGADFTYEVYIKDLTRLGVTTYNALITNYPVSGGGYWLGLSGTTSAVKIRYFVNVNYGAEVVDITIPTVPNNITMTAENKTVRIYTDGTLIYTAVNKQDLLVGNNKVRVGYSASAAQVANASYNSVRVYNRALTDGEIKTNYYTDKQRFGT